MKLSSKDIHKIMKNDLYPLSLKYEPDWILNNAIGSHCLWLMESLVQIMSLKPNMRILDIGCGKAISSIFLAKEFGVKVWATDLNVNVSDNFHRICEAGMEDNVFPIHADAHDLPYADSFFDAIVGINSMQFFALGDTYLKEHLVNNVKPGGKIGMIVPGIYHEFCSGIPEYLQPHVIDWIEEFKTWHSPDWWKNHLEKSGMVDIKVIDTLPGIEGNKIYGDSSKILRADDEDGFFNDDNGRNITFIRILATRRI